MVDEFNRKHYANFHLQRDPVTTGAMVDVGMFLLHSVCHVCMKWHVYCVLLLQVSAVTKMGDGDKVSVVTNTGTINDVDCLLWAIGRSPNVDSLRLDRVVSIL